MEDYFMNKEIIEGKYNKQFLIYLLSGYNIKEIAQKLELNTGAIRNLTKHLYSKFGAVNKPSLAYQVLKQKFIKPSELVAYIKP